MSKRKLSKIFFSTEQIQVLIELYKSSQLPTNTKKFQIKKLKEKFNSSMTQRHPQFRHKSCKAIQNKIKQIFNIKNHIWSNQLHQTMLNAVGNNLGWKQISKLPEFCRFHLSKEEIKIKFQSGLRSKFKALFRQSQKRQGKNTFKNSIKLENQKQNEYHFKYPPFISDNVFKEILSKQKIQQKFKMKIIQQVQKNALITSIDFFATHLDLGEQSKAIRSNKAKQTVLASIEQKNFKLIVTAIIKINSHYKKQKGKWKNLQIKLKKQKDSQSDSDIEVKQEQNENIKETGPAYFEKNCRYSICTSNPSSNSLFINQVTRFPSYAELESFNQEPQNLENKYISQNQPLVSLQDMDYHQEKVQSILFASLLIQNNVNIKFQ